MYFRFGDHFIRFSDALQVYNTNNKDISTSESAIPRNRAIANYSWLIDSVPSKMVRVCFPAVIFDLQPKTTSSDRTDESDNQENMGI